MTKVNRQKISEKQGLVNYLMTILERKQEECYVLRGQINELNNPKKKFTKKDLENIKKTCDLVINRNWNQDDKIEARKK